MNFYEQYKKKHGNVGGKTLTDVVEEIVNFCESEVNLGNKLPYNFVVTKLSSDIDLRLLHPMLQVRGIVATHKHNKCLNTVTIEVVRFVEVLENTIPTPPPPPPNRKVRY